MAIPPCYTDLGKSARDIFSKGYGFGFAKLDVTTKTEAGVEFNLKGSSGNDTGKVDGSLELKYAWKDYGLSFKEKWNTDNNICAEVSIEDQIAQGLKLTFDTSFAPHTGKKTGQIKTGYKRDYVNLNADVDFEFAGPTVNGAAVVGYEGWLAGYQFAFDSSKSKLTKNNFALGYKSGDFQIHASVNDGADFGGSIYQKISENLEAAFNLGWDSGTSSTRFAAAAKYTVDKDSSISAKICNTSQVGLGYSHNLRDGVKLTLSALIDGKNLNQGGHKVGLGLELKA